MNKKSFFRWGLFLIVVLGGMWAFKWVQLQEGKNTQILNPEETAALSVNSLIPSRSGITLNNPRHRAEFTAAGVSFQPEAGPSWQWQLGFIGDSEGNQLTLNDATAPQKSGPTVIAYARGPLIEAYLARVGSIEQRFILPQPLPLNGSDLVITGSVSSTGEFESAPGGWLWRSPEGVVSLGDVYVYDANGTPLEAVLTVNPNETRLIVSGAALANAVYPVTIDPEIGTNDFRVSDMGTDGDQQTDATDPAVAYNSVNNEYLVVWSGEEVDGSFNIYGQRINATTGASIGTNDFLISSAGNSNVTPAVAYNPANNEYLVVWAADVVQFERDIYGQRINAANGSLVGTPSFRISDMGPNGDLAYTALNPAVAYNSVANEYLVVWEGDDNSGSLVDGEFEIFGQRLNGATGAEVGNHNFRLSDMGPNGDTAYRAGYPAVVYNNANNEYLAVWEGDDNTGSLVDDEFEIYGQLVPGDFNSGNQIGTNDFRISTMGTDGDPAYGAHRPASAYNPTYNEYLVIWMGNDASLGVRAYEVFAQRLDGATGGEVGNNDFQISEMGAAGNTTDFTASHPRVAYNSGQDVYLAIWRGDDDDLNIEDAFEIFGQEIDGDRSAGDSIGGDERMSDMGNSDFDDPPVFTADKPAIAYSTTSNTLLIVWQGDDEIGALVNNEVEIYGQQFINSKTPTPSLTGTNTPTPTNTLTPTNTPTPTNTLTPTPTATPVGQQIYLPVIMRE